MDTLERLKETTLPPKEAFYSKLNNEDISDEDYAHAQKFGGRLRWNIYKTIMIYIMKLMYYY